MSIPIPDRQPSATDLAIGLATFLKLPVAVRLGLKPFLESGDFCFSIMAVEPNTGTYWSAKSRVVTDPESGILLIQFWDEYDTGIEVDHWLIEQTALAFEDFIAVPSNIQRRVFIQALCWDDEDAV